MDKVDQKSKAFFISRLQAKGWQDIVDTDTTQGQYYYCDIIATSPNGKQIWFELKQRNIPSTYYRDTIMEVSKLNNFLQDRDKYDNAYLVTFFTDRWAISNILQPKFIDQHIAAATTSFANQDLVQKQFVHYQLDQTYTYGKDTII